MNLKYLEQFLELSKHTSFKQYALKKKVTHAQVSLMVSSLEKEFGYQLLVRNNSRSNTNIELTKKGDALIKRIPFVFSELELLRNFVNSDENLELGNFDLFTASYLIEYWISPFLSDLKTEFPKITLNLFSREDAPTAQEKKSLLTISPRTDNQPDIIQISLLKFHIGLWASKGYLDTYGYPKNILELSEHRIICFDRHWNERAYPTMNWYMNNINFRLKQENVITIRSSVGIMKAAEKNLGIFSLSEESIKSLGLTFERILPEVEGPIVDMCLSYPSIWQNHKSIEIITNFLTAIFKNKR